MHCRLRCQKLLLCSLRVRRNLREAPDETAEPLSHAHRSVGRRYCWNRIHCCQSAFPVLTTSFELFYGLAQRRPAVRCARPSLDLIPVQSPRSFYCCWRRASRVPTALMVEHAAEALPPAHLRVCPCLVLNVHGAALCVFLLTFPTDEVP